MTCFISQRRENIVEVKVKSIICGEIFHLKNLSNFEKSNQDDNTSSATVVQKWSGKDGKLKWEIKHHHQI
jgi:hypothetical protein